MTWWKWSPLLIPLLVSLVACVPAQPAAQSAPGETVILSEPFAGPAGSLQAALAQRRSVRSYASGTLTWDQMGQLLWAAQGVSEPQRGLRTAPSAGATYPLELYLVTAEGVFHYRPAEHAAVAVVGGDRRAALAAACLGQPWVREAPASFVITTVVARTAARYGERALRYVDIEVGAAMQNLLLQAVALELGAVAVGAFEDAEVSGALDLPAEHAPALVIPVGPLPADAGQ